MWGTTLRAARARKNLRRCCVLLALLVHGTVCGRVAGAQEALVLSGGGAKGLAHVGVISGMEELGYDADIVIGTSMGAVVGALYAAGYSPAEITQRVLEIDWAEVFLPTPLVLGPDRAVRYPLISFDLRVDDLRFARGLIGQWRINRALAHLLFDANARARGNFDRLARRYRAITADLETGDVVVLAKGDLALAARASMAVPGIFAPIVWDGKVLVDGGITDNLPTGVARRMGADEIIAVDVGRPPPTIVDGSPWGIMQRALDLMQENTQRDPLPPDHLIVPELAPRFRGASFPASPLAIFAIGREAALRDLPIRVTGPPRERRVPTPPTWFARLEVEAPDTALEELARRVFEDVAPGPYDPAAVAVAVDRLYSTGLLEGVWPRVEEDPSTGEAVLLVRLDAPPRLSVSAAPGYENDRGGRAWVSLSRFTSLRDRPVVLTAAASTTGIERWAMLSTQLYARNRSALSMSVGAHARESDIRDFLEGAVRDRDAVRLGASATLEFPHILQDQLTSIGLTADRVDVEGGVTGSAYGPILRFSRVNPVNLVIGTPFLAEVEHRFGSVSYSRLAVRASRVFGGAGFGFGPIVDFRWTSQDAPEDVWSALGDDHAVPGFRWGEMRARSRLVAGLDATRSIRSAHLRLRARLGAVTHELAEIDHADWVSGGQVALVWRSPLGSVEVGYGRNTKGKGRIDVSLGRSF